MRFEPGMPYAETVKRADAIVPENRPTDTPIDTSMPLAQSVAVMDAVSLHRLIDTLPPDEVRVLLSVAQGLAAGLTVYGPLRINEDPRDMTAEALQELRDCVVYLTAAVLRARAAADAQEVASAAVSDTIPAEATDVGAVDTIPSAPAHGAENWDPDWEREHA